MCHDIYVDARFGTTGATGLEHHCVFACPRFQGLRQQQADVFQDFHGAMRSFMWHKHQKSVCALVLAIISKAQTSLQIRPHGLWLYERKREREIHYVHWASKAYEDESVFMSEAHLGWQ